MRSFQNFALACDHTRGHIFASDDNAHSENQLNIVELIITQMVKEGNTANVTNGQKFFQRGFQNPHHLEDHHQMKNLSTQNLEKFSLKFYLYSCYITNELHVSLVCFQLLRWMLTSEAKVAMIHKKLPTHVVLLTLG